MRTDAGTIVECCERIAGRALLLTLIASPMVWILSYSLAYSLGAIGLFAEGVTLDHWRTALSVGGLRQGVALSMIVAAVVTALATCGSLIVTLVAPQSRHNPRVLALICVPLATPSAVSALMAYQVLNPGGFLARLTYHTGVIDSPSQFPALVNDPYAVGILLTQTFSALPLLTLFFLSTWTTARADRYCQLA
jgi:putative spermidine/putrescine transport system permease protein